MKKVIFTGEIAKDPKTHELFVEQFAGVFNSADFQSALSFIGVGKNVSVVIEETE